MKKLLILLLLIPFVSAEQVFVIETDLQTYDLSIVEGYATNSVKTEGKYEVQLIKGNEILHKQYFDSYDFVEVFPGPECFDENMRLLEGCGFSNEEVEVYERIQVPKIEGAEYIEVLDGGNLLFKIDVREKNYAKYWIIGAVLIVIILGFILMRKYYKKQRLTQEKVV